MNDDGVVAEAGGGGVIDVVDGVSLLLYAGVEMVR